MRQRIAWIGAEMLARARRWGLARLTAAMTCVLVLALLLVAAGPLHAFAAEPTEVKVTEIALKDKDDAYLPVSTSDSTRYNLAEAFGDGGATSVDPVYKKAKTIEVTVEATVKTAGADPSSKVELLDDAGNVLATATFAQKIDEVTGDPVDYLYVATLDHLDADPSAEIGEGPAGIKVTFADTAGFALETDNDEHKISDTDKSYKLFGASVKEFDEGGTPVRKAYADGSFVIDRTAPTMGGMTVEPTDGSVAWSVTNDASGKSGTATITLGAPEAKMDLQETRVVLLGVDDTSIVKLMTLAWDETTKQVTFELPDGHWDIAYRLVDAAGNAGSDGTYTEVTVDGTPPEVSFNFNGTDIADTSVLDHYENGGKLIVTVREANFDKDEAKTKLNVWPSSNAEPEFSYTYDKDAWVEASPGVYTYTIDFDYEGTYHVVLNSEDALGNSTTSAYHFDIDGAPPTVTTQFVDSSGNAVSSVDTITDPLSAEVFNQRASVRVTISDHRLDLNSSTIALLGSSAVGKIPLDQFFGGADYPMMGAVLKTVSDTDADGIRTIVFDVTYPTDRVYDMPEVSAKDFTHDAVISRPSENPYLLIDTMAPVLAASISEDPAGASELGTTAAGAAIVNGEVNGSGDLENSVWFYKCGQTAQILLAIDEPCGIKSLEVSDPSGRYASADAEGVRQAGNANLTGAGKSTSFADLALADPLADGVDFSDDVKVKVTDFAGYSTIWTFENGIVTPGGETIYPTLLVEDDTYPTLTLTETVESKDVADAAGQNPGYVRFFNVTRTVGATITDLTLKYLRGFGSGDEGDTYGDINGFYTGLDSKRPVITTVVNGDTANPEHVTIGEFDSLNDGKTYRVTHDFDTDGDYEVSLEVRDVVGNKVGDTIEKFTIDKTAPTIEVTYDNNDAHHESYYKAERTATITVVEHNFDPGLFEVVTTFKNHATGLSAPTVTWDGATGDTHKGTVEFKEDGEYTLTVNGVDKAGNVAVLASDATVEGYDSGTFTIDTKNPVIAKYYNKGEAPDDSFDTKEPVVEFPPASGVYSGTNYYAHPISLFARVQDRNFSAADTTVAVMQDGKKVTRDVGWGRVPDERGENGYERYRATIEYADDGEYSAPVVDTTDLATNQATNEEDAKKNSFVIDLKPPTVKVDVDRVPASQGKKGKADDPVNFYNQATKMTFTVSDEHKLRAVDINDPDSAYTVTASAANAEGKGSVTLTVSLKDRTVAKDNEYDRVIVLTAEDLAGNQRTWTIDHTGKIIKDQQVDGAWKQVTSPASNVGINGLNEHPLTLVQDTIAPVVSLAGVTEGTYYNTPQTVSATVHEINLDWLKQFDPARTIVTITKYDGSAGRAMSSWTVPASGFAGSQGIYNFAQAFSSDGHYVVEAQFRDYATNLSNKASIGEFTIDMTPPQLTMEFDNNDVRNEKYYKAPRTATITVVEHNFDPSRFTIDTNGAVGDWSTNGDTHTITVYFGEGGPYNIKVNGSDLAGNEATELTAPEFIVDVTPPEVTIAGTAQRLGYMSDSSMVAGLVNAYHGTLNDKSAYNGVVVPVITYTDNEVLSGDDLDYSLIGSKHGTEVDFEATMSPDDHEMTVVFGDLGYVGEGAGDGSNWESFYVDDYAVDADDIYTITGSLTDQAGNEAEANLTFSVNRYGSNYDVQILDLSDEEKTEYQATGMLSESPTIVVREVNVSGVDDRDREGNLVGTNHHVEKEFANATTAIQMSQGEGLGYGLRAISRKRQVNGWSEYVYTVRSANFGEGSDSDHNDRGQGVYRVNVTSDDVSSNANTTAEFWRSDERRTSVTAAGATAEFILDELAPVIDDLNLPDHLSRGESYEASFHVTDDITSGNTVEVQVDGVTLKPSEVTGPSSGAGTFTFTIPAKSFNWSRSVKIVVRDYAGRETSATNPSWMYQSTFIPEALLAAGFVATIVGMIVAYRKRQEAAEPELPM